LKPPTKLEAAVGTTGPLASTGQPKKFVGSHPSVIGTSQKENNKKPQSTVQPKEQKASKTLGIEKEKGVPQPL
jgi:hypothetical protein